MTKLPDYPKMLELLDQAYSLLLFSKNAVETSTWGPASIDEWMDHAEKWNIEYRNAKKAIEREFPDTERPSVV